MNFKLKKCKHCEREFKQFNSLTKVCSTHCAIEHAKSVSKDVKRKEWNKTKRKRIEALKTKQDYQKELQVIFNKFIRVRDKDKPCISCNKPLSGKFDAGHFYSTGSYPELRFNEDNVHGQCVHCNQHKRGNLIEYSLNLPKRIGLERFEKLQSLANIPAHYTKEELKGLKEVYKLKIKNYEV